jgi:hypothetical protein
MPAHDDAAPLCLLLGLRFERSGQFLERLHSPADRAAMLGNHTYRRRQIAALGVASAHAQVVFRMGITCQGGLLYGARTRSITDIADRAEEALQWMVR